MFCAIVSWFQIDKVFNGNFHVCRIFIVVCFFVQANAVFQLKLLQFATLSIWNQFRIPAVLCDFFYSSSSTFGISRLNCTTFFCVRSVFTFNTAKLIKIFPRVFFTKSRKTNIFAYITKHRFTLKAAYLLRFLIWIPSAFLSLKLNSRAITKKVSFSHLPQFDY